MTKLLLTILSTLLIVLPVNAAETNSNTRPTGLADGPGIWVNLWHWPDGNLDNYCTQLSAYGINNLFLQTSRSNTVAIPNPDKLADIIETCHRHHIRVIAWSFAELNNVQEDADKLIVAAQFQTKNGHKIDAIAGNMEKNLASKLVEAYGRKIRNDLGPDYPMIAVVYSPLNHAPVVAQTPWKVLAQNWSAIAPMAYWKSKHQTLDAYSYTKQTIMQVRKLTGKPDLAIHVIGDGMHTSADELKQFLQACGNGEAVSASLYPNFVPTPQQLSCLSHYHNYFQSNTRFRLAAFSKLYNAHLMPTPVNCDPAQAISCGQFYQLVVQHLLQHEKNQQLSAEDAYSILNRAHLLHNMPISHNISSLNMATALSQPIAPREAITLIANVIAISKTPVKSKHLKIKTISYKRADRWLVQPVSAETDQSVKFVNYLDASQMLLQARAGLP